MASNDIFFSSSSNTIVFISRIFIAKLTIQHLNNFDYNNHKQSSFSTTPEQKKIYGLDFSFVTAIKNWNHFPGGYVCYMPYLI